MSDVSVFKELPVVAAPADTIYTILQVVTYVKAFFGCERKTGTLTKNELIDHLSYVRLAKKALENREKLVAEALKAHFVKEFEALTAETPTMEIKGVKSFGFTAMRIYQKRFDLEATTTEMGADWIEEHSKTIDFIQLKSLKE